MKRQQTNSCRRCACWCLPPQRTAHSIFGSLDVVTYLRFLHVTQCSAENGVLVFPTYIHTCECTWVSGQVARLIHRPSLWAALPTKKMPSCSVNSANISSCHFSAGDGQEQSIKRTFARRRLWGRKQTLVFTSALKYASFPAQNTRSELGTFYLAPEVLTTAFLAERHDGRLAPKANPHSCRPICEGHPVGGRGGQCPWNKSSNEGGRVLWFTGVEVIELTFSHKHQPRRGRPPTR